MLLVRRVSQVYVNSPSRATISSKIFGLTIALRLLLQKMAKPPLNLRRHTYKR